MDFGLAGKVGLVTGASGGIGRAIVRALAAEGARVALAYHSAGDAQHLRTDADEVLCVTLDLEDPASVRDAVAAVIRRWGRIDVLIACAWVTPGWPAPGTTPESISAAEFGAQLTTSVGGTWRVIQAIVPHMRANGWGRIVLLSSGAAEDGAPGLEHYSAAKAALHGLGRSLARSVGADGILVNIVMPGLTTTERHVRTIPAPVMDRIAGLTPSRHLSTPEDVARVVTFLASGANGNVTGSAIRVSGGLSGVVP